MSTEKRRNRKTRKPVEIVQEKVVDIPVENQQEVAVVPTVVPAETTQEVCTCGLFDKLEQEVALNNSLNIQVQTLIGEKIELQKQLSLAKNDVSVQANRLSLLQQNVDNLKYNLSKLSSFSKWWYGIKY